MKFEGRARIATSLDVTPLIDVVFLLLVFFLLTSTYIRPAGIDLDIPVSGSAEAIEDESVVVSVDGAGALYVDGEPCAPDALVERLRGRLAAAAGTRVVLQAGRDARLETLLAVMDRIRASGAAELAIAAEPARESP